MVRLSNFAALVIDAKPAPLDCGDFECVRCCSVFGKLKLKRDAWMGRPPTKRLASHLINATALANGVFKCVADRIGDKPK